MVLQILLEGAQGVVNHIAPPDSVTRTVAAVVAGVYLSAKIGSLITGGGDTDFESYVIASGMVIAVFAHAIDRIFFCYVRA